MSERMTRFWQIYKRVFIVCLLAVLVWGMAAHAYQYLNFQFSHDSLDGIYAIGYENDHKIELGRVFAPAYRYVLRGQFAAPWLTGFLGLVWIALGACAVAVMFDIRQTWLLVLLCGLMTVNQTVTALSATYLHDLDQNMFGMMMACLCACLWNKKPRGWVIGSVIALVISLGMYQSYVSVAIGLMMIALLLRLSRGEKPASVIRDGLWAVGVVAVSGVLFLLCAKGVNALTGIPPAERNNSLAALSKFSLLSLPALIGGLYQEWWITFIDQPNTWLVSGAGNWLSIGMIVVIGVLFVRTLFRRDLSALSKALIALIALLLPLGINLCYILTSAGVNHALMKYAFILVYALALLWAAQDEGKHRVCGAARWVSIALAALLLFSGVQTSNTAYFKKTSVERATYARMSHVLYDMIYYGYVPGQTEVVLEGAIPLGPYPGYEEITNLLGMAFDNAVGWDKVAKKNYFDYVLGEPIHLAGEEVWNEVLEDELFQSMPCYPESGYIEFIGDVLAVRLSY